MHQVNFSFTDQTKPGSQTQKQHRTSVQFSKYNTLCRWGSLQLYSPMAESQNWRQNDKINTVSARQQYEMLLLRFGAVVGCNKTTQCTRHHARWNQGISHARKGTGGSVVEVCSPCAEAVSPLQHPRVQAHLLAHCCHSLSSCFLSLFSCNVWDTIWRSWIFEHMYIFKFFVRWTWPALWLGLTMTMWTTTIVFLFCHWLNFPLLQ